MASMSELYRIESEAEYERNNTLRELSAEQKEQLNTQWKTYNDVQSDCNQNCA